MTIPHTDEQDREPLSTTTASGAPSYPPPAQQNHPHKQQTTHANESTLEKGGYEPLEKLLVADGPEEDGEEDDEEMVEYDYPDGGYGWVVLGCCMTLAALTMGWGASWGVFQDYYKQYVYTNSTTKLSMVGATCGLCMNAVSFLSGRVGDKFGFKRVLYTMAFVSWLGMFLAAWSTKLWQVVLTQGVMCGTGMGMGLPVLFSLPSQWFYKKRGLASGLAIGGAGFGGCICALIVRQMLMTIGPRNTLLVYSFITLFFMIISTILIRTQPNSPEARARGKGPWMDKRIGTSVHFYMLALCLLLNTFGYVNVYFYITQYVRETSSPSSAILTALPLSVANLCAGIGRLSIGYATDRIGPLNALVIVCFFASAMVFALWLTAVSFNAVIAFAIVYGLTSPTYYSLIPMAADTVMGSKNLASNVGICLLMTSPAQLGTGPIGGGLLDSTGGWHAVIVFGGVMQAVAGICILICRLLVEKKPFAKV